MQINIFLWTEYFEPAKLSTNLLSIIIFHWVAKIVRPWQFLCETHSVKSQRCWILYISHIPWERTSFFPVLWWFSLQWRHNERDGVSNHQPHDCNAENVSIWWRHHDVMRFRWIYVTRYSWPNECTIDKHICCKSVILHKKHWFWEYTCHMQALVDHEKTEWKLQLRCSLHFQKPHQSDILSWCWWNFLTSANQITQIGSCDRSRIHVPDLRGTDVWPGKKRFYKKCKNLENIALYLITSLKSKWKIKQTKNMNSWIW